VVPSLQDGVLLLTVWLQSEQPMNNALSYIHESLQHLAVPVADLTPDPKNARKHDRRNLDAIKASLEKFGMRQPIIVQKQGMIVRAGNGRLAVAQELGWSHLPALVVDESEAEAVAFAIADNRTAELAEWDWGNLSEILQSSDTDWSELRLFEDSELSLLAETEWGAADNASMAPKAPKAGVVPTVTRDAIDPDSIEDYEPEKDFYVIKVLDVAPGQKAQLVELLNKVMQEAGYEHKAAAY